MSGRSQLLIKNVFYNYFSEAWFLLLVFVTTPYIVNTLGVESYGILSIVNVLVGYLTMMEMGFGDSIVKYVAEYHVKKNEGILSAIVGNAFFVLFIAGLTGAAILALLNGFIVNSVLHISASLNHTARVVFYITAIGFFFTMITSAFTAIPKALQRFDITNKVIIVMGTAQTLLAVFLLYLGYDLKSIALLNLSVTVLSFLTYRTISTKLLRCKSLRPVFDKETFTKMFSFGSSIAISNVAAKVAIYTNQLLIGIYLPIANVSYYVIPQSLAFKLWVIPSSISKVIFPAFSELQGLDDAENVRKLYLRTTKYVMILVTSPMILMSLFAKKFLVLWIGKEFAMHGATVLQILTFSVWLSSCAWVSMVAARSFGRADIPAKLNAMQAFMNIGLSILLIPIWGVKGAAAAWGLHHLIAVPVLIWWTTKKLISISAKHYYWKGYAQPILISVLFTFPVYLLKDMTWFDNIYSLLGVCSLVYLLNLFAAYLLLFDLDEKRAFGFLYRYA